MAVHYQSLQELKAFWNKRNIAILQTILNEKIYEVASIKVSADRRLLLTNIISEKRATKYLRAA